ncbi:MAG: hypothetical protein J5663_12550 [Bacteroidaceae bacterium]|nr:hypothetical protein [Bacteroidaceae bacterium]
MNTTIKILFATLMLGGFMASCNDKDEVANPDDEPILYGDIADRGFFINGESKIRGYFPNDSIIKGYTTLTQHVMHYTTLDSVEHTKVYGYNFVMVAEKFYRIFGYDVAFNDDSTHITCNAKLYFESDKSKEYDVTVNASLDSIGRPQLPIARGTLDDGRSLIIQFRRVTYKSKYSDETLSPDEEFDI